MDCGTSSKVKRSEANYREESSDRRSLKQCSWEKSREEHLGTSFREEPSGPSHRGKEKKCLSTSDWKRGDVAGEEMILWQQVMERGLREKEERLRSGEELVETQKKRILELREENERLKAQLTKSEEENEAVVHNLAVTKEELDVMARHLLIVSENVKTVEEERVSAGNIQEEREQRLSEIEEEFRQLQLVDRVQIQSLEEEKLASESIFAANLTEVKKAVAEAEAEISKLHKEGEELDCSNKAVINELEVVLYKNENLDRNIEDKKKKLNELIENISRIQEDNGQKEIALKRMKAEFENENNKNTTRITLLKESISRLEGEVKGENAKMSQMEKDSCETKQKLSTMQNHLCGLKDKETSLIIERKTKDVQMYDMEKEIQELFQMKEEIELTKQKLEDSLDLKHEAKTLLSRLRTVQKEKFGQEEEKVHLEGKVHVLTDEIEKFDNNMEIIKEELAKKIDELHKFEENNKKESELEKELSLVIFELQGQVRSKDIEHANVKKRFSELQTVIEKAQKELIVVKKSLSTTEQSVKEMNQKRENMVDKITVEGEKLKQVMIENKDMRTIEHNILAREKAAQQKVLDLQHKNKEDEKELKETIEKVNYVKEKLCSMEIEKKKMEEMLESSYKMNEANMKVSEELEAMKGKRKQLETEITEVKQTEKEVNSKLSQKERNIEKSLEIKKLEKELKELNLKLKSTTKIKERLLKQIERNKNTTDKLLSDDKKLDDEISIMEKEITSLELEQQDKRIKMDEIENELENGEISLTLKTLEAQALRDQIKELKQKKEVVKKEIKEVEDEQNLILKDKRRGNDEIVRKIERDIIVLGTSIVSLEKELASKEDQKEKLITGNKQQISDENKANKYSVGEIDGKDGEFSKMKIGRQLGSGEGRLPGVPIQVQPSPFQETNFDNLLSLSDMSDED